jgi:hypothetical protein
LPKDPEPLRKVNPKIRFYLAVLAGTIFLLLPAFYNGYPILNPDDNTYLCSGFIPDTPYDRPITYGLILRLISLNGVSLFIAAFAQCWLVSWLLFRNIRLIYWDERRYLSVSVITILVLSAFSSLSWISSEMIPDVWTPIAFLCLFPILLNRETRANTIVFYVIYTLAVATHMSNVMIFTLVLLIAFLIRKWLFLPDQRKFASKRILVAGVLTLATILTMGSALSKSKHVFFVAAMLEQGILKDYLDEHCPTEHYKICDYKDKLPKDANLFLWSEDSPVQLTGGWHENKEEYNKIIYGSLTEPKYIWQHIKMSVLFSVKQSATFNIGDGNFAFTRETPLNGTIQNYLPNDHEIFEAARQQNGTLLVRSSAFNLVIFVVALLSALILLFIFISKKKPTQPYKLSTILMLVMVIINIWDCATYAQINGRYGCRVMWMIPMTAIIAVMNLFPGKSGDSARPVSS